MIETIRPLEYDSHDVQVDLEKRAESMEVKPAEIVTRGEGEPPIELEPEMGRISMDKVTPYSAEIETKDYDSHGVEVQPGMFIKDNLMKQEDKFISKATAMHSYDGHSINIGRDET